MTIDTKRDKAYTAWVDIMGSGIMMRTSLTQTKQQIQVLYTALETIKDPSIGIYGMNDGAFLVGNNFENIKEALGQIFSHLVQYNEEQVATDRRKLSLIELDNLEEEDDSVATTTPEGALPTLALQTARKFVLARACVAFGPIYAHRVEPSLKSYGSNILIGPGVSNAYTGESLAGPFGVAVHESARMHGARQYRYVFMRYGPEKLKKRIRALLTLYFNTAECYPSELSYPKEVQEKHRSLSREFFNDPNL